jgi:TolB-like protein/DNA-binding winged helix-turn-helix (wHTH) protein
MSSSGPGPVYEFFDFRLDCGRFELFRNSHPLRVERKPMELLILLASSEGRLVTREEIAQRLWSSEVFVDTEHGINTAIRKLRHLLRDDPDNPRFIKTITGMGYRFVPPIVVREPLFAGTTTLAGLPASITPDPTDSVAAPVLPQPAESAPEPVEAPMAATIPKPNHRLWVVLSVSAAIGLAVLVVTLGHHPLAAWLFHRDAPPIASLAVLPLDNLSGDPSQEYFADGMTDELITMLAKNSTLRITSRTSVMQYKGVHKPLPEIARALKVDGILEGSVSRSSNRVHMTLQLIRAATDTHLWAERYDRDLSNVAFLPDEAAKTVAARLKSSVPLIAVVPHIDPNAHDAYLRGRYFWFGDNYAQCSALMQKAIDLQPDYAVAWSGLSDCYAAAAVLGQTPPGEGFEKAHTAALRALELDGTLAEAHHSLAAYYYFHAWDWRRAEAESRRAIELNPNYAEFHHLYSYILQTENRDEEAFEEQKRATDLDPFSRPWALGAAYIYRHQFDAAIHELQQRAASHSQNFWLQYELARAYWLKGMKKEWAIQLKQAFLIIGDNASADAIQHSFATGGESAVAKWMLDQHRRQARTQYVSPIYFAYDYARLGQKEETLRALEDGLRERTPWLTFLQKDPEFDFLHSDPRYRSIVQQVGLPPDY